MSTLRQSMAEYLAVRRALGYKLEQTERFLGHFLDYLDANGTDRITVKDAVAWATVMPTSAATCPPVRRELTGEVGVTSQSGVQAVSLRQRDVPLKCRLLLRSQTSAR